MARYSATHPDPEEWHDLNSTGRICDLPSHPTWRAGAWGLMLAALVGLMAWGVPHIAHTVTDAASARPAVCEGLTADECTARAAEGW